MASKQVTDRQKSADAVIAVGLSLAPDIGSTVTLSHTPWLQPGETMPDLALFTLLLCRSLGAAKMAMIQADQAHVTELSDDPAFREARDQATHALSSFLVETREVFMGVFGSKATSTYFKGITPRDPVVLSRFAEEVADNLSKNPLPPPRVPGAVVDVQAILQSITSQRDALDQQLKNVGREVREAQVTLDARDAAMDAYDRVFSRVASTLCELLKLAGKPELAAKVRPSTKKPGQVEQDDDDGAGEPPAGLANPPSPP